MADPITPGHAARILLRASGIDMRDPSAAADEMWAEALTLAGVDYRDALSAVAIHYAQSTEFVRPFHVIEIARRIAATRADDDANRAALTGRPDPILPTEVGVARVRQMIAAHRAAKPNPAGDDDL